VKKLLKAVPLVVALISVTSCKKTSDAQTKFSTFQQREGLDDSHLLIRKIYDPTWLITYAFNLQCAHPKLPTTSLQFTSRDGRVLSHQELKRATINLTSAEVAKFWDWDSLKVQVDGDLQKRIESLITGALDIWLQPLRSLSRKKIISTSQFQLRQYRSLLPEMSGRDKELHSLAKSIEFFSDNADLRIVFGCDGNVKVKGFANSNLKIVSSLLHYSSRIYTDPPNSKWSQVIERFTLIHEIGHMFGLLDTYTYGDGATIGMQPGSIMRSEKFFGGYSVKGDQASKSAANLALASDDIEGIKWLFYYYHHGSLAKNDCSSAAGYRYVLSRDGGNIFSEDNTSGACVPSNLFLHNTRRAHFQERYFRNLAGASKHLEIFNKSLAYGQFSPHSRHEQIHRDLYTIYDGKANFQDGIGNTAIHYMIEYGAWSLFNPVSVDGSFFPVEPAGAYTDYDIAKQWQEALSNFTRIGSCQQSSAGKICIDINRQNNIGNTPMHVALLSNYSHAIDTLTSKYKDSIDLAVQNKWKQTVCDYFRNPPTIPRHDKQKQQLQEREKILSNVWLQERCKP